MQGLYNRHTQGSALLCPASAQTVEYRLRGTFTGNKDSSFDFREAYKETTRKASLQHCADKDWSGATYMKITKGVLFDSAYFVVARTGAGGTGEYEVKAKKVDNSEAAIGWGLDYLRSQHTSADGSWSSNVGITGLATLAFLNNGANECDTDVNKAIQYILANRKADGSIRLTIWSRNISHRHSDAAPQGYSQRRLCR